MNFSSCTNKHFVPIYNYNLPKNKIVIMVGMYFIKINSYSILNKSNRSSMLFCTFLENFYNHVLWLGSLFICCIFQNISNNCSGSPKSSLSLFLCNFKKITFLSLFDQYLTTLYKDVEIDFGTQSLYLSLVLQNT